MTWAILFMLVQDQAKIDEAVKKGCEWLLRRGDEVSKEFPWKEKITANSLVLLTLIHSKYYSKEDLKKLIDTALKEDIGSVYVAALTAMALSKIDASMYQPRIAQCGQYLVDTQCQNGQWGYNKTVLPAGTIHTGSAFSGKKTTVLKEVKLKPPKAGSGDPAGDNSHSQYAALGLRACMEANVLVPKETLERALAWWRKSQNPDGAWGYDAEGLINPNDNQGPQAYDSSSYGSMTVGAVGSICILQHLLGKEWKDDPNVAKGLKWLEQNYTVRGNPKKAHDVYYYLYALERMGVLYGTETVGPHEWYPDGAQELLRMQNDDGGWRRFPGDTQPTLDDIARTCFAILFLRRGTEPLIKSEDARVRK
jgi:hypothetical protein